MSLTFPFRMAKREGLTAAAAYRVARTMKTAGGTCTAAMVSCGFWISYKEVTAMKY